MKKYRFKNLRSFSDSGNIDFKPLSLLIGKNSSGKSTFIRSLALLKQSIMNKTSEPILWYGDLVDFGYYNLAKNMNSNANEPIEFTFSLKGDILEEFGGLPMTNSIIQISFTILNNQFHELLFTLDDSTIFFKNKGDRKYTIKIDDTSMGEGIDMEFMNRFFPYIRTTSDERKKFINNMKKINQDINDSIVDKYIELVVKSKRKNGNDEFDKILNEIFPNNTALCQKIKKKLKNLYMFENLSTYLILLESIIIDEFTKINYIMPLRAKGDRYFRIQGLNVDSVDGDGTNVPMILNNMKSDEKKEFNDWCNKHFGFSYNVSETAQNVSINVNTQCNSKSSNLIDVGFGYSQVLPIIVELWLCLKSKHKENLILIEQPELHLHPSFQNKLMEAFVDIVNSTKSKIIIETHSDKMINHLGSLIEKKVISEEKVSIYICEKDIHDNSIIKETSYDAEGYIKEWPFGFFS